jgi:hypothetical protein
MKKSLEEPSGINISGIEEIYHIDQISSRFKHVKGRDFGL